MIRLAAGAWSGGTGVTAEATCQAALLIADSYPLFSGSVAHPRDGNGASGLPEPGTPGTGGAVSMIA